MAPFKKYRVELFLEGYLKATRSARLEPEATTQMEVSLKPNIGSIALTVSPGDAQILVDNQPRGTGSRTLSLNAKPHTLTIQKAGYEPKSLTVTPRPGHQQALSIALLTLEEAYWASRPPRIKSTLGSELKLFRPNQTFTLGAPRRQPGRRANEAERNVGLERPFYLGVQRNQQYAVSSLAGAQFHRHQGPVSGYEQPASGQSLLGTGRSLLQLAKPSGRAAAFLSGGRRCSKRLRLGLPWLSPAHRGRVGLGSQDRHAGNAMVFPWNSNLYPPLEVEDNYADQSASRFLNFTIANYSDNFPVSADIGSFKPNAKASLI